MPNKREHSTLTFHQSKPWIYQLPTVVGGRKISLMYGMREYNFNIKQLKTLFLKKKDDYNPVLNNV